MSAETLQRLEDAVRLHVADQTDGQLVTQFVVVAGIVGTDVASREAFMATSAAADWEIRGLLHEGIHAIDVGFGADDDEA